MPTFESDYWGDYGKAEYMANKSEPSFLDKILNPDISEKEKMQTVSEEMKKNGFNFTCGFGDEE